MKKTKKTKAKPIKKTPAQPNWEQQIEQTRQPTEGELSQLSSLANRMRKLQWDVDQLDAQKHELQQIVDRIAFQDIPDLMEKWGLSEIRLKDGSRVTIKPFVKASMPTETAILKAKTEEERDLIRSRIDGGLEYLRKNGAESIIKNLLKVEFGKGQGKQAEAAIKALHKLGIEAETVQGVHPQTLTAWVRERLTAGKPIDMGLFGVFNGNIAVVEGAKP